MIGHYESIVWVLWSQMEFGVINELVSYAVATAHGIFLVIP